MMPLSLHPTMGQRGLAGPHLLSPQSVRFSARILEFYPNHQADTELGQPVADDIFGTISTATTLYAYHHMPAADQQRVLSLEVGPNRGDLSLLAQRHRYVLMLTPKRPPMSGKPSRQPGTRLPKPLPSGPPKPWHRGGSMPLKPLAPSRPL
ncbi:MAG: hypothetical protein R2857_13545 [Vampirovibrionales bacterium]